MCLYMMLFVGGLLLGADQVKVGEGNAEALAVGSSAPPVRVAMRTLMKNSRSIRDEALRNGTLDALKNPNACVMHRAHLNEEQRNSILAKLKEEGLLAAGPDVVSGVFPPLLNDESDCPHLPLTLSAAPGSNFGGHHSYPGGLAVHEAFNQQSALDFAALYARQYGKDLSLNKDWIIGAPVWHDWAKAMVLQWTAEGKTFDELNFGGAGQTDNNHSPGDSRTSAHHILGLAETMARGYAPGLVLTQASAHAAPTLGNEFKVVNWLRAAAIIARIDPVAKGYLVIDKSGHWRLPPLNHLRDGVDLDKPDLSGKVQANVLIEYQIHNLSDADFVESIQAVKIADLLLNLLAPRFGFEADDVAAYNNKFRNVVLASVGPERIAWLYSSFGLERVASEIERLNVGRSPQNAKFKKILVFPEDSHH